MTPPDNVKFFSKYQKQPEDIKRLETNRSNKDVHIFECPPVQNDLQIPESRILDSSSGSIKKR